MILRALARDREDRWDGAAAMRSALDVLRREHRAGPADVIAWKYALIPPVPRAPPRVSEVPEAPSIPAGPVPSAFTVVGPVFFIEDEGTHVDAAPLMRED